ncbi:POK9 protein, partial [Larus smithsonianus]|nr:POK9 protein [Larus smithsonianus]
TGSAAMDVATATDITIIDQKVHCVPLTLYGPLGRGLSALLIGRSSTTAQGLFVLPGVIDADYIGQIQAMVWMPSPPVSIPTGSRIAQLVPFTSSVPHANLKERGAGNFGSTGAPEIYLAHQIQAARPTLTCHLHNRGHKPGLITVKGMIDTGADVTVIS